MAVVESGKYCWMEVKGRQLMMPNALMLKCQGTTGRDQTGTTTRRGHLDGAADGKGGGSANGRHSNKDGQEKYHHWTGMTHHQMRVRVRKKRKNLRSGQRSTQGYRRPD